MNFKRWLKVQMGARDLNQVGLGLKTGVSGASVNRWVKGNALPNKHHCRALARVFGLTEEEVFEAAGYFTPTGKAPLLVSTIMAQITRLPPEMQTTAGEFVEHLYEKWLAEEERRRGRKDDSVTAMS